MGFSHAGKSPEQANFHHLVLDIAWYGIALVTTSRFLSVYAIRLGTTPAQLGWLTALPAMGLLLTSLVGLRWRRRYRDGVQAIFLPSLICRISFLLPAFTPFFPKPYQPIWLILAVAIPALPQGISGVVFMSLLRESIYAHQLPMLISRRTLAMNVTVGMGALGFGVWLEQAPFPLNYQAMFIVAYLAALVSFIHVQRLKPLTDDSDQPTEEAGKLETHAAANPWRSPQFLEVTLIVVVTHIAVFSVVPITTLRLVAELNASEGYMALFAMLELATGAAVAILSPPLTRWIGYRHAAALGMASTALGAVIVSQAHNMWLALPAAALIGGGWTTADISIFGFFTERTQNGDLTRYTTAFTQVVYGSIFVGPLLGTYLATQSLPLTLVLAVGAGMRFAAAAITLLEWKMPHRLMLHRARKRGSLP